MRRVHIILVALGFYSASFAATALAEDVVNDPRNLTCGEAISVFELQSGDTADQLFAFFAGVPATMFQQMSLDEQRRVLALNLETATHSVRMFWDDAADSGPVALRQDGDLLVLVSLDAEEELPRLAREYFLAVRVAQCLDVPVEHIYLDHSETSRLEQFL